jgi:hypothetical protein
VICWMLSKNEFIELLGPLQNVMARSMHMTMFEKMPLFDQLSAGQREKALDCLKVKTYNEGDIIRSRFDHNLYSMEEGEVIAPVNSIVYSKKLPEIIFCFVPIHCP